MNQKKREQIFKRFEKSNNRPTTDLVYHSNFELLISVILSAQATDMSVNKATRILYKIANTPKKIFALGEAGLKEYIKPIGLYNKKAKNIINTCEVLMKHHCSRVPTTREELEALPGVGRKTANVILNIAFGKPTIAVDTHIYRVAKRIPLALGKTPMIVEKKLNAQSFRNWPLLRCPIRLI